MGNLKIQDELSKVNRRLERLEKGLDILNSDREILEDVVGRLTALEEQTRLTRQHDNAVRKDIKEEINTSGDRVVAAVQEEIERKVRTIPIKKIRTNYTRILAVGMALALALIIYGFWKGGVRIF